MGEIKLEKMIKHFHTMECILFRNVNRYFAWKRLNAFFRTITHCGGATFTISVTLIMLFLGSQAVKLTALAALISLAASHLPVAILKKMYPRRRPYLVLDKISVTESPLEDHSFPSGHTTAIFSVLVPFVLMQPVLAFAFIPLGLFVAISRVYLGLHYPSDVLAGILLGSISGISSFFMITQLFPY